MSNVIILPMADGGIYDVKTSYDYWDGCETCDYGSCYINEFTIEMTQGIIYVKCSQMYEFVFQKQFGSENYGWGNPPWSEGEIMKILLPNNDLIKEMEELVFVEWFKEELNKCCSSCFLTNRNFEYNFERKED